MALTSIRARNWRDRDLGTKVIAPAAFTARKDSSHMSAIALSDGYELLRLFGNLTGVTIESI